MSRFVEDEWSPEEVERLLMSCKTSSSMQSGGQAGQGGLAGRRGGGAGRGRDRFLQRKAAQMVATKLAEEGVSGLGAGKAGDEAGRSRTESMDSSTATTLMELSISAATVSSTTTIATTLVLPFVLTQGEGTSTSDDTPIEKSSAMAGEGVGLSPDPSAAAVADVVVVETDDTSLTLGEGNTNLILSPPPLHSATEAFVEPAAMIKCTAIVPFSPAAAAVTRVLVPSVLDVAPIVCCCCCSSSSSCSSRTTTTALIKAMVQLGVCSLVHLPFSIATALSCLRPHCTDMVVYTGGSSSIITIASLTVRAVREAMRLTKEDVVVFEGGVPMEFKPMDARTLLWAHGQDTVAVFPVMEKVDLRRSCLVPPMTPLHVYFEDRRLPSLLAETEEQKGGMEGTKVVTGAGVVEVEDEDEREGGEEQVLRLIDFYLSVAAEGEQVQTWEEFFASTPPPGVPPSFVKALGLRLAMLAGSMRGFVMRTIRWLRERLKKGKKGILAACQAVVRGGRMVVEKGHSLVQEGRTCSTCNAETCSSSSNVVDAAHGRGSSKGYWRQLASSFSPWGRKMRPVFL